MSLLPAAMRLPNDITPLGRKVVPLAPPMKPDLVKAFEKLHHPFPDGTYKKPPLGPKPFFSFDFGAADMTSMVINEVYKAALLSANPPIVLTQEPRGRTAVEITMKQRATAERIHRDIKERYQMPRSAPKRLSTFNDLDFEVTRAAARVGKTFSQVERSVKNAFGGRVRPDQVDTAINFVNNLFC
jgi:hypothetical protein